jgi:hypothetical protein
MSRALQGVCVDRGPAHVWQVEDDRTGSQSVQLEGFNVWIKFVVELRMADLASFVE